jgi:hypothetical protein
MAIKSEKYGLGAPMRIGFRVASRSHTRLRQRYFDGYVPDSVKTVKLFSRLPGGPLNKWLVLAILLLVLLAFWVGAPADGVAQQNGANGEEEAIDLDSLKEEEKAQNTGASTPEEALLPMDPKSPDIERHPALMLGAFAILLPVATLLLPMRRNR